MIVIGYAIMGAAIAYAFDMWRPFRVGWWLLTGYILVVEEPIFGLVHDSWVHTAAMFLGFLFGFKLSEFHKKKWAAVIENAFKEDDE